MNIRVYISYYKKFNYILHNVNIFKSTQKLALKQPNEEEKGLK